MSSWIYIPLLMVACYLIGSIPFGLLVARLKGIDIREHGSRNIGATNVSRVLGKTFGIVAFFMDVCKGLIPTGVAGLVILRNVSELGATHYGLWLLMAIMCILGHVFPVYLRLKGGKGVATALGATLGVYPYLTFPALFCFGVWLVVTLVSRYVSLGSLVAACVFPVAVYVALRPVAPAQHWPIVLYVLAIPALVIFRHRANITRLIRGTESTIGESV